MRRCLSTALPAVLFLLCATAFWSCHKDFSGPPIHIDNYDRSGMHALMAPLRSAPQTFTVTAGVPSNIVGAAGTVLRFYPNSFKRADGTIVANGTVEISLEEMYHPGEMIANGASTVSNGTPLISGGQIHIVATQNGQVLYANKYGIRFPQPAASTQPMRIFTGNRNNADSIVTWPEPVGNNIGGTLVDSLQMSIFYQFDTVTSFNWINCDYFYNSPGPLTNLTATLPDTSFNPSNTMIWIVFPSINSVSYLSDYDFRTMSASLSPGFYIPVGIKCHVVLMSNKSGTWYYAERRNLTVMQNQVLSLVPTPKSLAEIKAALITL